MTTKYDELIHKQRKLEQCKQCIKKVQDERKYLNAMKVTIWSNFCVIATPPSSMYSNSPYHTNNIGERIAEAGGSISTVESLLKHFTEQIKIDEEQMKRLKWYNIRKTHKLSDEIASHKSDVRLLSLLIEQYYKKSEDIAAMIEKERVVKKRMEMLYECKQRIIDELHDCELSLTFEECDKLCADDYKNNMEKET